MEKNSTGTPEASLFDGEGWFDAIEAGVRDRIRGFIESMLEEELTTALGRERYRRGGEVAGYRHGVRFLLRACFAIWFPPLPKIIEGVGKNYQLNQYLIWWGPSPVMMAPPIIFVDFFNKSGKKICL